MWYKTKWSKLWNNVTKFKFKFPYGSQRQIGWKKIPNAGYCFFFFFFLSFGAIRSSETNEWEQNKTNKNDLSDCSNIFKWFEIPVFKLVSLGCWTLGSCAFFSSLSRNGETDHGDTKSVRTNQATFWAVHRDHLKMFTIFFGFEVDLIEIHIFFHFGFDLFRNFEYFFIKNPFDSELLSREWSFLAIISLNLKIQRKKKSRILQKRLRNPRPIIKYHR